MTDVAKDPAEGSNSCFGQCWGEAEGESITSSVND
jgi:hypothetical protein